MLEFLDVKGDAMEASPSRTIRDCNKKQTPDTETDEDTVTRAVRQPETKAESDRHTNTLRSRPKTAKYSGYGSVQRFSKLSNACESC